MSVEVNSQPALSLNLHLPMNGAWSAEIQLPGDVELATGDAAELALPGLTLIGRVARAGVSAERLSARITGGSLDWSEAVETKHYKDATVDQILTDLGVEADEANPTSLPFWTRSTGTVGSALQSLANYLGVPWRVNPDATVRLRAETPAAVDVTDLIEITRDPARGVVECTAETAVVLPGTLVGDDSAGDVLYTQDGESPLRVRYYTEARDRLRGALERVIRWVTRDTLFLGQYTAEVVRQAADGTLDLLPDDARLRSQGLQAVPIRHGLPGVTVQVPAGERVLLAFDAGDPSKPYAALWHAGQATKIVFSSSMTIEAAGTQALALAVETKARLDLIQSKFDAHTHLTAGTGSPVPPAAPMLIGPLGPIATSQLKGA